MTEMTIEKPALPVDLEKISEHDGLLLDLRRPFDFFFAEEDGVTGVSDVEVNISLTRSGSEVFAAGTLRGTIKLQCGRCLADFEQEISATVEEPFFPKEHGVEIDGRAKDAEVDVEEDEGDVNVYEGDSLDLFAVLRDQLFLEIPLKPLCKEDCKGLCPNCGANLNATACGCKLKTTDPRLAVLKNLKDKL
jgi:uncharacterized protein